MFITFCRVKFSMFVGVMGSTYTKIMMFENTLMYFNSLCLNSLSPECFNLFLYKAVTDRTESKISSAFMTSPMMCAWHKQNIRLSSNTQHAVHQPGQFLVFLHHCFQICIDKYHYNWRGSKRKKIVFNGFMYITAYLNR
jgi:hypothetical protein